MNADLRNVALNLVAGLLMFVFGFVSRQGYAWLRSRRVGGFWRPMANAQFTLVFGRFPRPDFLKYEPSGLVGLGDGHAEDELRDLFQRARLPPFKVAFVDSISNEASKGNLILLGGTDNNRLTAEMIQEVGARFHWDNEPLKPPVLVDTVSGPASPWKHFPVMQDDDNGIDFGVVVRARNPRNSRCWIVIIAGCLGYGTWAGAQLTEQPDLVRAHDEFEFIYRTEVVNGAPRRTTSVTGARRLPSVR